MRKASWLAGQSTRRLDLQENFRLAQRLVGAEVCWANDAAGTGERMRVEAATSDGMVQVSGYSGNFSPTLFRRVLR
jgi:hypothetical protein